MKKRVNRYKPGELLFFKKSLPPKEIKILDKYITFCKGTASEDKVKIVERQLLMIRDISKIPFDKWNLTKLREFLAVLNRSNLAKATQNDIKKHFKRFLREQYEDWSIRFKGLKDLRCSSKSVNQERVNANKLLNPERLEKVIRTAETLRYKALIILSYETGARPKELLTSKWKDINLEKGEIKLISTKNSTVRTNTIQESILHLKRYKQEYPYPNVQESDFVFPSTTDRKKHLSVAYWSVLFGDITKKAIGERLFPYILRHTRATELQKVLPPKIYEKFMDHSIEMASAYSHLNQDDVREVMLEKVYHIEELTKEDKQEIEKLKERLLFSEKLSLSIAETLVNSLEGKKPNPKIIRDLIKDIKANS
jgi:integrase